MAALLVVALTVDNLWLMLREPNTQLVALQGMDRMAAAGGNVVITPGVGEAVVMLRNLPVLPKGQSYYLWAAIAAHKIAIRGFNADENGQVLFKVPLSKLSGGGTPGLAVTVEVSSDPTHLQGPMVMTITHL